MPPTLIQQPAPCHESWAAMTPTEVGRHCAACQTQVVDFTAMTDGEVVFFLEQYHPARRCGRFREDQVGRPLLAAARPVAGWRRWAGAAVLLLGSVVGIKVRAQGTRPGPNAKAMQPAATRTTYAGTADSLFLVRGVVRNRWGFRQAGARVGLGFGLYDTTNTRGYFQFSLPKYYFVGVQSVRVFYRRPDGKRLVARVAFDSSRTEPYRIRLKKPPVIHNPGFF